ncbi:hypothetical protein [Pseudomonas ficuserectae]|uniref:hypothetical protein n=1 Tax=Pseudomonas ficuserectae TaxID=53410 RepID=UPI00211C5997|nr:hypothetical protein [Pseudomonas ficuserectae]
MELFAIMATFSTLASFENSLTDAIMRPQPPPVFIGQNGFFKSYNPELTILKNQSS